MGQRHDPPKLPFIHDAASVEQGSFETFAAAETNGRFRALGAYRTHLTSLGRTA